MCICVGPGRKQTAEVVAFRMARIKLMTKYDSGCQTKSVITYRISSTLGRDTVGWICAVMRYMFVFFADIVWVMMMIVHVKFAEETFTSVFLLPS
jgi:hypothetical protein